MRRRGLALLGALVMLLAGTAIALLTTAGGGDAAPTLEAGSAYGGGPSAPQRPDREPAREEPAERSRPRLPLPPARAAARLMVVGFAGREPSAPFFERLRTRGWGGVVLERANYADPAQLAALAGEVTVVARAAGQGAPLVAAVQPGGADTAFPDLPPREAVLTPTAGLAAVEARRAGRRLRSSGIALTFAPVAHLGSAGGPWEGYAHGDEPGAVGTAVAAAVSAYRSQGVAAVAGRFPGEGGATQDPARGAASVGLGLEELRGADMVPFRRVARTAPAIQMSPAIYAAWDGVTPATLLPEAVDALRGLGFRGLVVSADLSVTTLATGTGVGTAAVEALKAGCDLLWVPGDLAAQEEAYRAVVKAIRTGEVPAGHVAAALGRIAALKRAYRIR